MVGRWPDPHASLQLIRGVRWAADRSSQDKKIELETVSAEIKKACPRCGSTAVGIRRIRRFGFLGTVLGVVLLLPSMGLSTFGGLGACSILNDAHGEIGFTDVVTGGGPTADVRQRRLVAGVRANAALGALGLVGVLIGGLLCSRRYARSCLTCESGKDAATRSV